MSRDAKPNLADVPIGRLLAIARGTKARRAKLMEDTGKVIAELHKRGLSWRVIGQEIGVPSATARNWAKPYLLASDDPTEPAS